MRIVSLLGSATEILFRLGLGNLVVGISHECDFPPEALGLPRVSRPRFDPTGLSSGEIDAAVRTTMREHGSVYEVDGELLADLCPTLVIAQQVCEVCAVPTASVRELVTSLPRCPRILSLDAHTVNEILNSFVAIGAAAGAPDRAEALVAESTNRIEVVRRTTAGAYRPRVLLLEWLDPPFAPGHWVPEMVDLAGGHNLLGHAATRSEEIPDERLLRQEPDVLLIEPCGFTLAEAMNDASRHRPLLERIAPGALASGRTWVLDSALFSRSGPRVVEGIELLARLFHPDLTTGSTLAGAALYPVAPG